ncbi:terminase large subunit [Corynebacterium phage EmiRose]|uniref:Terminase large subunit n=1 Tax=Corynebacterium phage EmiRose TaxID=2565372 RepID=A0A649VQ14_9CAUD|nr:terminase large subunit [Corynebacterium phage EmiRose]QGJ94135.1 terminase large subunit [Corynebacterium phage EmiRose]
MAGDVKTREHKDAPGTHYDKEGKPSSLVTPEWAASDYRLKVPPTLILPKTEPVGVQTPSHFVAPLWHTTAGDDAVDLAAACGLDLLPWQQLVLRNALGERLNKWAAFEVALVLPRQNGKNVIITARQLAGLFLFDEEQQVHTAHKFKTARSAHRDLVKYIQNQPELWEQVRSAPTSSENTAVVLHDGRRIDFLARQGGQGRGLTGDTVYLDEAFQLPKDVVGDLLPTLSARPRPQLWYTSSAGMEYSEVLETIRNRAIKEPQKEKFLAYMEWSADLGQYPVDSVEAVAVSNPSLGYFQDWEWIEGTELKAMDEEKYARERLGVWHDKAAAAVIGPEVWKRAAITADDIAGIAIVKRSLAIEVTPDRSLSVIAGAAELEDGRVVVEIIEQKAGTAWLVNACESRVKTADPHAGIVFDSFSGAMSIAPMLAQRGIPISAATTRDLTSGTADFYDKIMQKDEHGSPDPHILHPVDGSEFLDDAAFTARRRLVGSSKTAWTWAEGAAEVSLTPLRAVTLALKGLSLPAIKPKKKRRVV